MSTQLKIDTRVRSLKTYLDEFEKGLFQIPSFQRDFIWEKEAILSLFDSIKNNYPIGSILFWKPLENYPEYIDNSPQIGPYALALEQNKNKNAVFILDGLQRLSSLFGCLTHPKKTTLRLNQEKWEEQFNILYDLKEERFMYPIKNKVNHAYQVPIYIFMNSTFFRQYERKEFNKIADSAVETYLDRADKLSNIFLNYQIASVDINDATIEEAVEIFRRVNEKGKMIEKDQIVSALTNKDGFRMASEIDDLLSRLEAYRFEDVSRKLIFQCIQNAFGQPYFDTKIDDLIDKKNFAVVAKNALKAIEQSVQFLYEELLVLDSKLLPYTGQLSFLALFFTNVQKEDMTKKQKNALKQWFWETSYSSFFTNYNAIGMQRKAYQQFKVFIQNENENPFFHENQSQKNQSQTFFPIFLPDKIQGTSARIKSLLLFMLNNSHKKQNIVQNQSLDIVEGQLFKLAKKDSFTENHIYFVGNTDDACFEKIIKTKASKNNKDYSFLLDMEEDLSHIFISAEMQKAYKDKKSQADILKMRKDLIEQEESEFLNTINEFTNKLYFDYYIGHFNDGDLLDLDVPF